MYVNITIRGLKSYHSFFPYRYKVIFLLFANNADKGKGKVHPCTGTEALYRLYGPEGEYRYSSTLL
jgi:hypothetical protein